MPDLPRYALHDPALCLAPGLFRSLPKAEKRPANVRLEYQHSETKFIFDADKALGCDDLRILQGLLAIAHARVGVEAIAPTTKDEDCALLRSQLDLSERPSNDEVLLITTTFAKLARAAGYANAGGGGTRDHLTTCLNRLAGLKVAVEVEHKDKDKDKHVKVSSSWRLISHDAREPYEGQKRGALRVALNPRSSGQACGWPPFTQIDMKVARAVQGNPARILNQRLTALVSKTKSRKLSIYSLMRYLDGPGCEDASPTKIAENDTSKRKRRYVVMRALDDLRSAGWSVTAVPGDKNMWLFEQPSPKRSASQRKDQAGRGARTRRSRPAEETDGSG